MKPIKEVEQPRPGQEVVWNEQRKWGGKQSNPAIFLRPVGKASARIAVAGKSKTVRLSSLTWEGKESQS